MRVKNWEKFQHYKDRNPLWIKLHRSLLDDSDYCSLSIEARAYLPMLWLLAAEKHGELPTADKSAWRLRADDSVIKNVYHELMLAGFLVNDGTEPYQPASNLLQTQTKVASLEKRREETYKPETEKKCVEPSSPPSGTLPLNDGSEYPIYKSDIETWSKLYPAVDVIQECRNMKGWLLANPTRRKTKRGIAKFINSWLSQEQDKGGSMVQRSEATVGMHHEESNPEDDRALYENGKRLLAERPDDKYTRETWEPYVKHYERTHPEVNA